MPYLSHRNHYTLRHPTIGEISGGEAVEITPEQVTEVNTMTGVWQITDQPPADLTPVHLRRPGDPIASSDPQTGR